MEPVPTAGEPAAPPSEQVCDAFTLGFAAWTLLCNGVAFLGGSFALLRALAVGAGLVALLWLGFRRLKRSGRPAWWSAAPADDPPPDSAPGRRGWLTAAGVAVAAAACASLHLTGQFTLAWWLLVFYFVAVLLLCPCGPGLPGRPAGSRGQEAVLWGLALFGAAVTLVAHRPDADDSLYLGLATAVVDEPDRPLLRYDSLHGAGDIPLHFPVYRVHAFEPLMALVSSLTGLPVIAVAHLGFAAVAGALCCLAWGRLLRLLAPRGWVWGVVAVLAVYLLVGGPHRWHGNFGFVRFQQGKAVLASVGVPLLIAYALRFAARPSPGTWCLLAAVQVAALGLTWTGVWVAPAVVGLASLAMAVPPAAGWRAAGVRLALAAASCGYPVVVALLLRGGGPGGPGTSVIQAGAGHGDLVGLALAQVFGTGLLRDAVLVMMVLAWRAGPTPAARRLCLLFPLSMLLALLNPALARPVIACATGLPTYWRVLWVLPVPLFMALVLAWPLTGGRPGLARAWRLAAYAAGLVLFVTLVPPQATLSRANQVLVKWPSLKVDRHYATAAALHGQARRGDHVLAPEAVAQWLPTFHHHPYPVLARRAYRSTFRATPGERARRVGLAAYVAGAGDPQGKADLLRQSLAADRVALVCVSKQAPWLAELQSVLRQEGFTPSLDGRWYEVWRKPDVTAASAGRLVITPPAPE